MRSLALGLAVLIALPVPVTPQAAAPPVADAEIARGIALVDEGEYDAAILALDAAVRRLSAKGGHSTRDLAEAYFHLGVAYLAKGHETSAKARFREAVRQMRDMSPNPERFPPRVIELFEKAREESKAEGAAATAASAPKAEKKGGSSKVLLIVGGLALAGGGAALALGGGASSDAGSTDLTTRTESGTLLQDENRFFPITTTRQGQVEITVTWQNRAVHVHINCQQFNPPYTDCAGAETRTSDTSNRYVVSNLPPLQYLIGVVTYDPTSAPEPFTITLRYP